ncbi:DNA repair protein XRCC4 isoform X5 [Cuculus canorus]|nr:DNA repair protein XRCC4 isoform X5 [Cuculus canorus]XP_053911345.1 DNA repair protein XRCC4 isoform X5 [Cuculus canorus]XP_053911346.1 DNA repair protein XRCC4 isoform X5 [Cuculus canorus]XP_053911347.1 DNA repair protein XRCC4 isoform X5 [Cuculus canorus]XP_053911348.1 DNA repair protein XRCC4 isoform X5 [Cuculus canorus]XP_053911349.1 DNA repair protein XRCC4 isoform X5 [Cuculus canorus]
MEKILNRIHPVSDPEATYFLQVSWEKDLGVGFGVTLTDGQCAWTGTVSEAEISREAADMEMNREKYVEELKKALISGEESRGKYNFAISRDDKNMDCHFSYERNLKDGSFRLGSLKLQKVSSPADVVKDLIGYCLDCLGKLQAKNEHLQKENERLFSDWSDVEKRLEKCVEAKEELEADLYNRFILVLNEKKAKIRNLQKLLSEAKESASDAKCTRDSIATTQMATGRENDYDGSTDEESENLTGASLPSDQEFEQRCRITGTFELLSWCHVDIFLSYSQHQNERIPSWVAQMSLILGQEESEDKGQQSLLGQELRWLLMRQNCQTRKNLKVFNIYLGILRIICIKWKTIFRLLTGYLEVPGVARESFVPSSLLSPPPSEEAKASMSFLL